MKLGDILENKSAGEKNPNKRIIFLREDSHSIHCLGHDGVPIRFYRNDQIRDKFLTVIGSLDLTEWLK